jgi:hypothetical protein
MSVLARRILKMNGVIDAKANDDYSLDLKFNDGRLKQFDIKPYLESGVFQELKDMNYFKRVRIAFGTVQWPNEQDISPATLYIDGVDIQGSIQEQTTALKKHF